MLAYQENKASSFILVVIKKVKFWVAALLLVSTIWSIDLSLRPYIIKILIDRLQHVTQDTIIQELGQPIITYLLLSFLVMLIFRLRDFAYINLTPVLKRYIFDNLMQRMMQHSINIFHNNFSGNLVAKIKDVASGIPDLIKVSEELLGICFSLIIATFTVWTINYQFSILFILWLTIFISITLYSAKHAKKLCIAAAEAGSTTMGRMVDILSNIMNIKLFASQQEESKQLMTYLNNYVVNNQTRDRYFMRIFVLQGISFIVYQTLSFILLIHWYKLGKVTIGDFALLVMLNSAIVNNLWALSRIILNFTESLGNISQGLQIVLKPIEILDKINAKTLPITNGKITFEKVKFNYPGANLIFDNLSLTIAAGQKIGLVGYSGGGKSTFVNLILRLYDIIDGNILIDQHNIQDLTLDSLHNNIAMIPQEPILFHRSLMENIRYGKFNASDTEVIKAAQQANAHDFIMRLASQYDSLVGERGVKLSGGQRQRIAIARAILKNAPILIFDEATSQLDSITEQDIQASLWQLMQNKTTLIIAHRLSTLLHVDRILVFHQGKIIEDGTHLELMAQQGLYKNLWDTQVGGFIQDEQQL
jgi:ATP-binding cassette subfamily B protein